MHQENKMDIHITMGSEEGLLFIADTDLTVTSNPNHVNIFLYFRFKTLSINLKYNQTLIMIQSLSSTFMSNKENKNKPSNISLKHLTKLLKMNMLHLFNPY